MKKCPRCKGQKKMYSHMICGMTDCEMCKGVGDLVELCDIDTPVTELLAKTISELVVAPEKIEEESPILSTKRKGRPKRVKATEE